MNCLKNESSKDIAVQTVRLIGNQNVSLTVGNACGRTEFGLDHKTFLN